MEFKSRSFLRKQTRRTGECDVTETSLNFLKTDLKFVATAASTVIGLRFSHWRKDERAGDYSRAARERFVFHAAFIGADGDFLGPRFL
jgi:hypothetical protein